MCGRVGATLPCGAANSESCLLTYHYPCAVQAGTHGERARSVCMYYVWYDFTGVYMCLANSLVLLCSETRQFLVRTRTQLETLGGGTTYLWTTLWFNFAVELPYCMPVCTQHRLTCMHGLLDFTWTLGSSVNYLHNGLVPRLSSRQPVGTSLVSLVRISLCTTKEHSP